MKVKLTVFTMLLFTALTIFVSTDLSAYPNGIAGRTLKTSTQGCGSCHSSNTAITGTITGPDSILAGQTVTLTLTINCASGSGGYGVDIAAKLGTLAIISGQGLKVSGTELVHSSAISYANPKVITFSYTAPSTPGTDTLYATIDRGYSGRWNWTPNKGFKIYTVTGVTNNETPIKFYLSQNYPNPFNPVTKINYGVAKPAFVKITIYNLLGKEISVAVNEFQQAGNYFVNFDASKLSTGVYYYRIEAGDFTEVRKMTLIK